MHVNARSSDVKNKLFYYFITIYRYDRVEEGRRIQNVILWYIITTSMRIRPRGHQELLSKTSRGWNSSSSSSQGCSSIIFRSDDVMFLIMFTRVQHDNIVIRAGRLVHADVSELHTQCAGTPRMCQAVSANDDDGGQQIHHVMYKIYRRETWEEGGGGLLLGRCDNTIIHFALHHRRGSRMINVLGQHVRM